MVAPGFMRRTENVLNHDSAKFHCYTVKPTFEETSFLKSDLPVSCRWKKCLKNMLTSFRSWVSLSWFCILVIKWCCEWWLILFISCFANLLTEFCHKVCIQRQMVIRWKHFSYFLYGKYLKKNSFIPSPHWLKLENFVMQLKRQSVEAWQNEKHSNTRIIPARTQSQDDKFSNKSTMSSTKVRSGHNICCLCSSLSFQAVLLLTKTVINHRCFFLIYSEVSGWI